MSDDPVTMTEIEETRLDWTAQHRQDYLRSGGTKGHVVDVREIGGLRFTTCLLLKTVGRKSGEARILPLIYGDTGGEVVIVASKGGADVPPAWYLNLQADPHAEVQVRDEVYKVRARDATDEEKPALWAEMVTHWPAYDEYQTKTERPIPVVVLERA